MFILDFGVANFNSGILQPHRKDKRVMLPTKISKRNLLTLAFAAFTLVMLGVAAVGGVNYNRFYPAITQIQTRITSLQTTAVNNIIEVKVAFAVKNPTDYQGLSLSHFGSTYSVVYVMSTTNNVTALGGGLPYPSMTGSLGPGTTVSIPSLTFNITANPAQATGQSPTMIILSFQPTFILGSFLNTAAEVIPSYDCTSSGSPAVCNQTGITLITSSVGGPSAAGG